MKSFSVTIQIKATEQYFPVVLFIILYMVVLTPKCDHSNESYGAVLSSATVYHVVKGGLFLSLWKKLEDVTIHVIVIKRQGPGISLGYYDNDPRLLLKESKRKIIPKETPSCSMIPRLLVVFTLQLEIVGVVLTFASVGEILES